MTKLILASALIIAGMLMASLRSESSPHAVEGTSPALPVMPVTLTTEQAPATPSVVSYHTAELESLRAQLAEAHERNAALEAENRRLKQFTAVVQTAAKPQPVRYYYQPQRAYSSCGPGGCGPARRGLFGRR